MQKKKLTTRIYSTRKTLVITRLLAYFSQSLSSLSKIYIHMYIHICKRFEWLISTVAHRPIWVFVSLCSHFLFLNMYSKYEWKICSNTMNCFPYNVWPHGNCFFFLKFPLPNKKNKICKHVYEMHLWNHWMFGIAFY